MKIELKVYGKYINIDEQIAKHKNEATKIDKEIIEIDANTNKLIE